MGGRLLLFGFDTLPAILAVEAAAGPLGAEVVPVARGDYNRPLGVLAGMDTMSGLCQPYAGGTLGGRMIVICGMEPQLDTLLPALSNAGAGPDCLKAVLTRHNRSWNALTLYTELLRERQTLQRGKTP